MVSKREKGEKEYFQRNVSITEDIGHIAGSCMPICLVLAIMLLVIFYNIL